MQPVGEKNELVSQKMTIAKQTVTATTYGGYVNVSPPGHRLVDSGDHGHVINDLAGVYAQKTEAALCAAVMAAAPTTETIPTGAPTTAAAQRRAVGGGRAHFTATAGQGRLAMFVSARTCSGCGRRCSPPSTRRTPSSPGFKAADFSTGAMGQICGIPVYMSAGLAAASTVVVSSSAVEVYEDRIGSLSVVEPCVLGVQVAYAGYFASLIVETTGLAKIIKTP